jgi:hemerythrin
MAYLEWDDRFSIGVELFDNEHKKLIALINELYDAVLQDAGGPAVERILDRLVEHAVLHFRHEEMYFEDWNFPDRDSHTASHRRLRHQIFEYREQIARAGDETVATELFAFLRQWLTKHILTEDRKYGAFLVGKGLR